MSLVAAFLWNKSPRSSISTLIFDDEEIKILSQPKIQYFQKGYFRFRSAAKNAIKEFFHQVKHLQKQYKEPVIMEFKIVFHAPDVAYLIPSKESKYVYDVFVRSLKKLNLKSVTIKPQLRQRLKGRSLKSFKKGLRSLYLVSRKKDAGYEYHLWTVALHATPGNYIGKLSQVRRKLERKIWNDNF